MSEELVSIDDILAEKTPQTATVKICLVTALTEAVNDAHQKAQEARRDALGRVSDSDAMEAVAAAEAALEVAQAARLEKLRTFKFKALGRDVLEAMEKAYPVTREQLEDYRATQKRMGRPATDPPTHDVDEFPPALIAASCVSPVIPLEKAKELWNSENWSKAELGALFQTAWAVNTLA